MLDFLVGGSSVCSAAVVGGELDGPEGAVVFLVADDGDVGDLGGGQVEGGQVGQVALQAGLAGAGGDGDDAAVDDPAQGDGAVGDCVLSGELGIRVVERAGAGADDGGQGRVGGDGDAAGLEEGDEVAVLEVGVELDLVDGGDDVGGLEDVLDVFLEEVGEADGAGAARGLDGLELGPAALDLLLVDALPVGRVDQVEVDVVEAELLQRQGKGVLDGAGRLGVVLCDDEELLAGDAGGLDGGAELLLVAVDWTSVGEKRRRQRRRQRRRHTHPRRRPDGCNPA